MKKLVVIFLCFIICLLSSCESNTDNIYTTTAMQTTTTAMQTTTTTMQTTTTTAQIVTNAAIETDWYEEALEPGSFACSYSAEYNLEFNSIEALKATMLKMKSYEDVLKFGGYGDWSKKQIRKYNVIGTMQEESVMITEDKFFLVANVKNQKFKKAKFHGRSLDYYYGDDIHIHISTNKSLSKSYLKYDDERLNVMFTDNQGRTLFNELRRDFYCFEQYNYAILIQPYGPKPSLEKIKDIANNLEIEKIEIK